MATGQPFLATWNRTDNTLRLFELASEKFVQVGTVGVAQGADMTMDAFVAFTQTGNHIFTWTKASLAATTGLATVRDLALATVATANSPASVGGAGSWPVSRGGLFDYFNSVYNSVRTFLTVGATGTLAGPTTSAAAPTERFESTSPNEKFVFEGRTVGGTHNIWPIVSSTANGVPTYGTGRTLAAITDKVKIGEWSTDSRFLMLGSDEGSVDFWQAGATVADFVRAQRVAPLGIGPVVSIARRYDNRFWAVGFFDGSTYRTVVFKRFGGILKVLHTFDGMGKCLGWTADGLYLLDASAKRAYRYDGEDVFTAFDSLLSNVPANVASQAISPHKTGTSTVTSIYPVGVLPIVAKTYNAANLKVALLAASVTFDHTATSAASILAAGEVSGNNWAAGGEVLQGVGYTGSAGTATLKANKLTKTIAGGQLTFRNLLVYDASDDMPIVFVAGSQDTIIDDGVVLGIDFSTPGMVQFST